MDAHAENKAELRALLAERRARLRAFADEVLDHVTSLSKPETPLEAERTARAVMTADRMLCQLFAPPPEPKIAPTRTRAATDRAASLDEDEDEYEERYPGDKRYTFDEEAAQMLALERAEAEIARHDLYERRVGEVEQKLILLARGMHLAMWRDEGYTDSDVSALLELWTEYRDRIVRETGEPPDVEIRRHPSIFAPDYRKAGTAEEDPTPD
ncbi:hypothetical protein [Asticcacaulis sp. AND118]|uniref:hypothetical protein n=1 Tax=Asticcacaulis sp. AND118 TaxID=2840468 RepID=UPI001CFFBD15|nr:hypothetical protein [Asticcacaulis sp. AND118]UDF02232.1 hypothetical protein LH365_07145 [Asticcacaulis sp. AND118]